MEQHHRSATLQITAISRIWAARQNIKDNFTKYKTIKKSNMKNMSRNTNTTTWNNITKYNSRMNNKHQEHESKWMWNSYFFRSVFYSDEAVNDFIVTYFVNCYPLVMFWRFRVCTYHLTFEQTGDWVSDFHNPSVVKPIFSILLVFLLFTSENGWGSIPALNQDS